MEGRVRKVFGTLAAVVFLITAYLPDPLPLVDEIVGFLLMWVYPPAGIVAILIIVSLAIFGIYPTGLIA